MGFWAGSYSVSKWIGPQLEFHNRVLRTLATFDVPRRVNVITRPDSTAFPPGLRVINSPRTLAWEESQRVGDPQRNPLAGLWHKCQQCVRVGRSGYRNILSKA